MRQHVRKSCKIAPNKKNGDRGMELLYEHTIKKQQAQIDAMQQQNKEMQEQNKEMLTLMRQLTKQGQGGSTSKAIVTQVAEGPIVTNNKGTVVVDNKRITINVFGKENLSHITRADVKAILDASVQNSQVEDAAQTALLKMAMAAYSDPHHPENITCFLPNKKTNDALVHTSSGWEVQPVNLVVTPMAERSMSELFDKQPYENYQKYDGVMRELRDNGKHHVGNGSAMRPILVRNKALVRAVRKVE